MTEVKQEKVLFKYHSNVLDELTVETMWAEVIDKDNGIFKLEISNHRRWKSYYI